MKRIKDALEYVSGWMLVGYAYSLIFALSTWEKTKRLSYVTFGIPHETHDCKFYKCYTRIKT